ncbi:MAG TPA: glycosyltransferase, partial [Saprospiraceae bacterium]|nr:glycosyltransferase [Saprospiraceae bacterium]
MKVAIIQEWLVTLGGSEKVVQALTELYPDADIFTLVLDRKLLPEIKLEDRKIVTSIIQKLPFGIRKYKNYLPIFPFAIEQFDLTEYDLVISSSHAVAKGVLTTDRQLHITYCHSPMRYAWDLYHQYLEEAELGFGFKGILGRYFLHKIRLWDVISANRPDYYISNSNFIAKRIKKVYGRLSTTIYPPIEIDQFTFCGDKEDYYVTCSRMVSYKRIDLIAEAFGHLPDKRLIIIGDGPDFDKVKSVSGSNIELKGFLPTSELVYYLQRAKAFVFAAIED